MAAYRRDPDAPGRFGPSRRGFWTNGDWKSVLLDVNPTGPRNSRLIRTKSPRERAAAATALEEKAHPHMLRHACSYGLANKGHDTRAIQLKRVSRTGCRPVR